MGLFQKRKNINFLAVALAVIIVGLLGIAVSLAQVVAVWLGHEATIDIFKYFSTGIIVMALGYISLQVEMMRVKYPKNK